MEEVGEDGGEIFGIRRDGGDQRGRGSVHIRHERRMRKRRKSERERLGG